MVQVHGTTGLARTRTRFHQHNNTYVLICTSLLAVAAPASDNLGVRDGRRTSSGEVMRFSTARITPSFVLTPTAVDPSCTKGRSSASDHLRRAWPSAVELWHSCVP